MRWQVEAVWSPCGCHPEGQSWACWELNFALRNSQQQQSRLASACPEQGKTSFSVPPLPAGLLSSRAQVMGSCAAKSYRCSLWVHIWEFITSACLFQLEPKLLNLQLSHAFRSELQMDGEDYFQRAWPPVTHYLWAEGCLSPQRGMSQEPACSRGHRLPVCKGLGSSVKRQRDSQREGSFVETPSSEVLGSCRRCKAPAEDRRRAGGLGFFRTGLHKDKSILNYVTLTS